MTNKTQTSRIMNFQCPDELITAIKNDAAARRLSASDCIRQSLSEFYEKNKSDKTDRVTA